MECTLFKRKKNFHTQKELQRRQPVFQVITAIIWLWALTIVFVMAWGLIVSVSDGIYYSADPTRFIPRKWRFQNYIDAFAMLEIADTNFWGMVFNSIWFSFGITSCRIGVTIISAYTVARYKFFGKKALYGFLILQMMVPLYGQTTANYELLAGLQLIDSPLIWISWGAGHGMYFLILHSFFVGLDSGYEEAGRLDGASEFTICFKLMLPLSTPVIVAMFITFWTGAWSDYMTPLLYLPSYPTLSAGLFRYRLVASYTLDIPIYFAGIFIGSVPPAVIFTIFSDTIMTNMTIGGLKG